MANNQRRVRALVFDAYGTLFDVYGVTALCEELFPGKGAALASLWRAKQLHYSLLRSLMERYRDFWHLTEDGLVYAAKSLGLALTPEGRERLMQSYLVLPAFPDARAGLERLKAMDIRLAILSNGSPAMLSAAVASAGLATLLDDVISVDEVRVFKPSPRVYGLVESHLGVAPAATGFVSSNSWDVNGAGAAGLTAYWIQRAVGEPQEELGFPAARVLGAITDLPDLVR
ncbi:MAG: haloacid dehalogenase type II [Vicinamibacterales bacterium]